MKINLLAAMPFESARTRITFSDLFGGGQKVITGSCCGLVPNQHSEIFHSTANLKNTILWSEKWGVQ
jgi:hypothetical protein